MKQQSVIIHTSRLEMTPTLGDLLSKSCAHKSIATFYVFVKKYDVLKCCSLKDLSSSYVSCKTVYRWVKTNCCFVSDMIHSKAVVTTGKKTTVT